MRAAAVLIVLLLLAPAVQAGPLLVLKSRTFTAPGWSVESFTLVNSSDIYVVVGDDSASEIVGHLVALYDDAGKLLRGTTYFSVGGQVIEADATAGGVSVDNEGAPGLVRAGYFQRAVGWTCDAACNPSRKFHLVVTGGGELEWWGYALYTRGANHTGNATGKEAFAYTTRQFDTGTILHVGTPYRGAHVAKDATLQATFDDKMLVTFVKPSTQAPARMGFDGPAGTTSCPCLGEYPPGAYTFRYDDTDTFGVEGILTYADVKLPIG